MHWFKSRLQDEPIVNLGLVTDIRIGLPGRQSDNYRIGFMTMSGRQILLQYTRAESKLFDKDVVDLYRALQLVYMPYTFKNSEE